MQMIPVLTNVPYTMIYKLKESDNLQNIWWFMYNNFKANTTAIFLCVDYRSNCVSKSKCSKFYFKTLLPFLRKNLYALVWIPLESQSNFNKPKIFKKYFA